MGAIRSAIINILLFKSSRFSDITQWAKPCLWGEDPIWIINSTADQRRRRGIICGARLCEPQRVRTNPDIAAYLERVLPGEAAAGRRPALHFSFRCRS